MMNDSQTPDPEIESSPDATTGSVAEPAEPPIEAAETTAEGAEITAEAVAEPESGSEESAEAPGTDEGLAAEEADEASAESAAESAVESEPEEAEALGGFAALGLPEPLLRALDDVGYEDPSPIQAGTIPHLLEGRDVLGQAQTGTGKTAAFALPILARLGIGDRRFEKGPPRALVLAPTRELAIQVAEAFQRYASHSKGFRVLPIYGGQGYDGQLRQLKRGVHVVVGTPGRVMDHMRRGTLDLGALEVLVLDEADEMLRMGFREDVEWILEKTPESRQIALFSATLAPEIRRIAGRYLKAPEEVRTEGGASPAETIRQRFWVTSGVHKLDALTRMLEVEPFDGMIVFVRTKTATLTLAEKLGARGFSAAPINGDMAQPMREQTVKRLDSGRVDILVATDVAARGLDIERVSHVVNFDIPYDTDSYVHRVGRTGRAGRQGEAILFVAPRERRMLHAIERATGKRIERMELPSVSAVNDSRVARFEQRLTETLEAEEWKDFHAMLERYQARHDVPGLEIAAALAKMLQGDQPFLLEDRPEPRRRDSGRDFGHEDRSGGRSREEDFERYRVAVGHAHGVGPGDLVGAIAGETGLSGRRIGRIEIRDDHSFIDLPAGMPAPIRAHLRNVRVRGQALDISSMGGSSGASGGGARPHHGGRPGADRGGRPRPERGGRRPPFATRDSQQARESRARERYGDGGYGEDRHRPGSRRPGGHGGDFERAREPQERRSGAGRETNRPQADGRALGGAAPRRLKAPSKRTFPGVPGHPAEGGGPGGEPEDGRPRTGKPRGHEPSPPSKKRFQPPESGGRRTGKKARWSKAKKRAAKKNKK